MNSAIQDRPLNRGKSLRRPLLTLARALSAAEVARAALVALIDTGHATRKELRTAIARLNKLMGEVGVAAQTARRFGIVEYDLTW